MTPAESHQTKRMRRIRRNVKRVGKDFLWMASRLPRQSDPEVVLELHQVLSDLARVAALRPSGVAYQESRLPKPDGPLDCVFCHVVVCAQVPIRDQRRFEEGLSVTGRPPRSVWEMPEYRSTEVGKGRGCVLLSRPRHSNHIVDYREWKPRARS